MEAQDFRWAWRVEHVVARGHETARQSTERLVELEEPLRLTLNDESGRGA